MPEKQKTLWGRVLLLMFIRVLFNTVYRMVYPLLPVFGRGIGVDINALSGALATRSFIGAGSPLVSWIGDRYGRRVGILVGLLVFAIGLLLVILFPTFPMFVVAISAATLGKYIADPAMHAFVGDEVPYAKRGRVVAVIEMGWSLAFILGVPLVGYIIRLRDWVAPFPLFLGLTGFAIIVVFRAMPADHPEGDQGEFNLRRNLMRIFQSKSAVLGLGVGVFVSAANEMVSFSIGYWLEDAFQVAIAALAGSAIVIGASELLGETLVGSISDRLGKIRSVGGGVWLNCLAALALPVLGISLTGALVGLFLFYITFEFALVSSFSIISELSPSARATYLGVNISGLSLGRALADLIAPAAYQAGIGYVVAGVIVFNLFALLALRGVRIK